MTEGAINHFISYIKGESNIKRQAEHQNKPKPDMFILSSNGNWTSAWFCPYARCLDSLSAETIKECERETGTTCGVFASRRTIYWDNGINTKKKKAKFKSRMSDSEIRAKLTDLGFIGSTSTTKTTTSKITKKYENKGEKSIALSWEGYEELIVGKVKFDEKDYKGTLETLLPNNDGTCDGTYSLQEGGKGTWQIACTNNMGAAGTLKWDGDGGVTGIGRDHNDKKVKFTVSKNS
mgnify:CR=1 FL=1